MARVGSVGGVAFVHSVCGERSQGGMRAAELWVRRGRGGGGRGVRSWGRVSLREMGGGEMEKREGAAYIVGLGGGEGGVVAFGLGGRGVVGLRV